MLRRWARERLRDFLARRADRRNTLIGRLRELLTSTEVLDPPAFISRLREDISKAKAYVLVVSPFLRKNAVNRFINDIKGRIGEIEVIVLTKPAKEIRDHEECIRILKEHGIKVVEKEKLHFKAAVIDDDILYIGSINLLSIVLDKYIPEDYMLRFISEALTAEVIDKAIGWKVVDEQLKQ